MINSLIKLFFMRNFLLGTSLLLGSFVAPTMAEESKGFYLSIGGAQTFIQDVEGDTTISGTKYDLDSDIDSDFGYEIEFGKQIENWRLGISYGKTSPKQKNVSAENAATGVGVVASVSPKPTYDVESLMFNVYRDFPNDGKFTPYVGIGLGSTSIEMQTYTTTVSGTDVVVTDDGRDLFSWDIKGGVTYSLNQTTDLYGEVVYLHTDSFDEDGINYDAIKSTNLMAGIKFNF